MTDKKITFELKRMDDMEFSEISQRYEEFFSGIIDSDMFFAVKSANENKYTRLVGLLDRKLKFKSGTFGRADLQYGRNMLYGWFLEDLFLELLKKNKFVASVTLFGGDKKHDFFEENEKINIFGEKTTIPDFDLILKNGGKLLLELKSAAKNIFSIKKGNVEQLIKSFVAYEKLSIIIMVDINIGAYEIKGLDYFKGQKLFVNQRMEGQLCYEFPVPQKPFCKLLDEDFTVFSNKDIRNNLMVEKLLLLKRAKDLGKKELEKIIINKLKIEKIEEQFFYQKELSREKIAEIKRKNKLVRMSWQEIKERLG